MKDIKIKLCGMMKDCDIDYANEAGPDYVGFVFANTRRRIDHETAQRFRQKLKKEITAVGVFVNEDVHTVAYLLNEGIIEVAQLHGTEDEAYIIKLRELCPDCEIIKAARVNTLSDIEKAAGLPADYLLLDACSLSAPGGTGKQFNWQLIEEAKKSKLLDKPWFLAGGLNAENVEAAKKREPFGLDLSSGIETDGAKNRDKMIEITRRIRHV